MDIVFKKIKNEWKILFLELKKKESFHYDYLDNKLKELIESDEIYYPNINLIHKPLTLNPQNIKLVIVGQDPYANSNADGLAFSCKNSMQKSLKVIFKNIKDTTNFKMDMSNGNLEYLHKQNVLLLNYYWSIKKSPLDSKYIGWGFLTTQIIRYLSLKYENIVFILFGRIAEQLDIKIENKKNHLILIRHHPSFGSDNLNLNFDMINDYIFEHHKIKINFSNK